MTPIRGPGSAVEEPISLLARLVPSCLFQPCIGLRPEAILRLTAVDLVKSFCLASPTLQEDA